MQLAITMPHVQIDVRLDKRNSITLHLFTLFNQINGCRSHTSEYYVSDNEWKINILILLRRNEKHRFSSAPGLKLA